MATNAKVFDEIAESWYRVHHWSRFSRELKELSLRWKQGRLLNIGCAHGPDFLPFKDSFELWGLDISSQMIRLARKYAAKFNFEVNLAVADAVSLPYRDSSFDWAIAIAVYHNIRGEKERQQAFLELRRVLRPGGEAFITVWNRWQPGFWLKGKEVNMPWRLRENTVYRYYYLFSYLELNRMLKQAGFRVLRLFPETSYRLPVSFFSRNICALVRK
jgi:tRNA (uracil-5-)-methyltransferase TRM9